MVKILNRNDDSECAQRLANCRILIGDEYFGVLPRKTSQGKWYDIKPHSKKPILGSSVKIETTVSVSLHFADIYVYGYDFVEETSKQVKVT